MTSWKRTRSNLMKTCFKFKSETKLPMNTGTQRQTAFTLGLIMAACSLPLHAQQNPPPSRFNVELGAIREPNVPTEIPAVSWESALIDGPNVPLEFGQPRRLGAGFAGGRRREWRESCGAARKQPGILPSGPPVIIGDSENRRRETSLRSRQRLTLSRHEPIPRRSPVCLGVGKAGGETRRVSRRHV